jgi:hypothetical protein
LDILAVDNVPDQIIHTIYNIYSDNKISIKSDSNPSKWEPINKGVRQGCGLSLFSLIMYMGATITHWRGGKYEGMSITKGMVPFAVLIASSEDELQRAIYNLEKTVSDFYMSISI